MDAAKFCSNTRVNVTLVAMLHQLCTSSAGASTVYLWAKTDFIVEHCSASKPSALLHEAFSNASLDKDNSNLLVITFSKAGSVNDRQHVWHRTVLTGGTLHMCCWNTIPINLEICEKIVTPTGMTSDKCSLSEQMVKIKVMAWSSNPWVSVCCDWLLTVVLCRQHSSLYSSCQTAEKTPPPRIPLLLAYFTCVALCPYVYRSYRC
jgi:hypothetical protein